MHASLASPSEIAIQNEAEAAVPGQQNQNSHPMAMISEMSVLDSRGRFTVAKIHLKRYVFDLTIAGRAVRAIGCLALQVFLGFKSQMPEEPV